MSSFEYLKGIKGIQKISNPSASTVELRIWHEQDYGNVVYLDSLGNIVVIKITYDSSQTAFVGSGAVNLSGSVSYHNQIAADGNRYIRFVVPSWCKATAIYI